MLAFSSFINSSIHVAVRQSIIFIKCLINFKSNVWVLMLL